VQPVGEQSDPLAAKAGKQLLLQGGRVKRRKGAAGGNEQRRENQMMKSRPGRSLSPGRQGVFRAYRHEQKGELLILQTSVLP